jgi:hypothetical protein
MSWLPVAGLLGGTAGHWRHGLAGTTKPLSERNDTCSVTGTCSAYQDRCQHGMGTLRDSLQRGAWPLAELKRLCACLHTRTRVQRFMSQPMQQVRRRLIWRKEREDLRRTAGGCC